MIWIIIVVVSALVIIILRALTNKEVWNPNYPWEQRDAETGRKDMLTQLLIDVVLLDLHRQVKISFRRAFWLYLRKMF